MASISNNPLTKNYFWALLIFAITLSVYLFTLCPTVYLEDSGELITAAAILGIPHPPGYPLWVLIGKLFSFIPVSALAWRINLMSAFFGALTSSGLFLIIRRAFFPKSPKIFSFLIPFSLSLAFAFSLTFWSQSVVAEVYTLNTFFVILCLWLLLKWSANNFPNAYLFWFAFVYGLSLTNHQMMLLLAPAFFAFIFLSLHSARRRLGLKSGIICCLLFFLGLSIYLYLPLRSLANPALDWGNPETLRNFWAQVSRQQYHDLAILAKGKFGLAGAFIWEIIRNFSWPVFLFALVGLFIGLKKHFKISLLTLLIFLFNSFGIILLRRSGWGLETEHFFRVYYLPCFLMLMFWLALVLKFIYEKIARLNWLKIALLVALLSFPLSLLISNFKQNDKSDFWLAHDCARSMLAPLKPNGILLYFGNNSIADDTENFSLIYLQEVEKFRRDVLVIPESNFSSRPKIKLPPAYFSKSKKEREKDFLRAGWQLAKSEGRPLYTDFIVNKSTCPELGLFSYSLGNVYRVFSDKNESQPLLIRKKPAFIEKSLLVFSLPNIRNLDQKRLEDDYSSADLMARYYYRFADFCFENGLLAESSKYLRQAINLDAQPFSPAYQNFIIHRREFLAK